MNSFAAALREFQEGARTKEDLEEMIDRDVGLGTVAPDDLILLLNAHQSTSPLGDDDFATISNWISRAETRLRTQVNPPQTQFAQTDEQVTVVTQRTEISVGSVINDRFALETVIGSGGMSQVFKAKDQRKVEARSRDPYVAVKVMDVRGIEADQAFIAMQREVQKCLALNHQNIVRVHDFDRDGDIVFTTMELLEGESLQQMIARANTDAMPLDEAINIIRQMGEALECAHESGIVHADFKPSNVFITVKKRVKVIDFGIARAVRRDDTTTVDQTLFDARDLGAMTPAYASPEMIEDLETHPRDDVYALGCVAYELITGMHPYSRMMATEARDRNHPLNRPANLSKQQWAALERTLQFDSLQRTQSVREFLDEFLNASAKTSNRTLLATSSAAVVAIAVLISFLLPSDDSKDGPTAISSVIPSLPGAADTFSDCPTCPTMTVVRGGVEKIGLPKSELPGMFEFPQHNVAISGAFAISTHEVTVAQFRRFADSTNLNWQGCRSADNDGANRAALSWRTPGFAQNGKHPVTCISWQDAQQYAAWLSGQTGENYRLPTETEWEYTARTMSEQALTVESSTNVCARANVADATAAAIFREVSAADCSDGFAYTAPVDRLSNDSAVADMRGNVFEWTQDCWNPSYDGAPVDGSAWLSGDCSSRVLRGGSWYSAPEAQRLTFRNHFPMNYRSNTFGFRIVRAL
jgi:formylglycine-generating enzyme required for sulfatase activity/tRNA A-37 threonylcarbamoyl transferase component Bud32